jgi:hypothetical protein
MTKPCKKCGVVKPLHEFYEARGTRDGHRGSCKSCESARRAEWYQQNRERVIGKVRSWRHENRDRYLAYQRDYKRSRADAERAGYLRRRFGLSIEDYYSILASQGGGCGVCGALHPDGKPLHVDHDHATGRVRGLLCFNCNGGLGQFRDDVDALANAIGYLARNDDLHEITVDRARELVKGSG